MPYTYLIGWSKLKIYYYGRRTARGCHPNELWIKYFTSSKEVTKFRRIHGEPDICRITKIFTDIDKCKLWEEKFLTKVDARNNPHFLNKVNSDHKLNPIITGPCTLQRRDAISYSRKLTRKMHCIFCNGEYDPGNFKQYHGKNCKLNPSVETDIWEHLKRRNKESHSLSIRRNTFSPPKTPKGVFTCPKCGKEGTNWGAMHQFHFENCGKQFKSTMNKRVVCSYCNKETNIGNYKQHHGINCKQYQANTGTLPLTFDLSCQEVLSP